MIHECPSETDFFLCRNDEELPKELQTAVSGGRWAVHCVLQLREMYRNGMQRAEASLERYQRTGFNFA